MQNYSKLLGLLLFSVAALTSCEKKEKPESSAPVKTINVDFSAQLADEDVTKTTMTIGSGNTASFDWEASDRLKVRQIYYRGSTLYSEVSESGRPVYHESNNNYHLSAEFTEVSSAPDAHFTGGYRYLYQGFYPAGKVEEGNSGAIRITLPAQQTPRSQTLFDAQADILYADAVYSKSQRSSSIGGRTINGFIFHRLSSVGVMHITGAPSGVTSATIQSVEFISTTGKKLAGTYTFNVNNPNSATNLTSTSAQIKMNVSGISTNFTNFTVCFTCLPATCNGYKVRVTTTKGQYEKTFSTTQVFQQGQASFFNVNMNGATYTPKSLKLMTYNVAAFRLYDQFNLKHQIYLNNNHYWKRPGQSNYVLYNQSDYDNNKKDNTGEAIITHAVQVLATAIDSSTPTLIGFNELDCNLRRNLGASANVRSQNGTVTSISMNRKVDHGFQLKQLKSRLEQQPGGSWWYHFAKARDFGSMPVSQTLLNNINNGEQSKAYGNGVVSNKRVLKDANGHYLYSEYSLGNANTSGEENRCISVLETEDCVFASVHMGGVGSGAGARVAVITNQANKMTNWFRSNYMNYPKPVFVCGDFNAYPNEIQSIMGSNWNLLSRTDINTHSGGHCLDYIFSFKHAAQVEVVESQVITSVSESVAPYGIGSISDHLPIWVKVNILP